MQVIMLGAGGHASVLIDLILLSGGKIKGIITPEPSQIKNYPDIPYLGDESQLSENEWQSFQLVNGIGSLNPEANKHRHALYQKCKAWGYSFATLIHPRAIVASTAQINEGAQIMAGVVIQPNVVIDQNSIINTRTSVDHDCIIGKSCHVAPGVTLSGNVQVGDFAHVGVGATVIQGIEIGSETLIRAGTTVVLNKQKELA